MGRLRRGAGWEKVIYTGIAIAVGTVCACTRAAAVGRVPNHVASAPVRQTLGLYAPQPAPADKKAKLQRAAAQLDELFGARVERAGATSAVVGIVMNGELVYQSGFGTVHTASNERPDASTLFRIGSVSKSFAATAVVKLRDEGRLGLDDAAVRYVPELAQVRGLDEGGRPMTVRDLLTMTSGFAYDDVWGPVSFGYDARELRRLFEEGVTLASQPGERYAYSNLGYAILGLIVERVSGQPFRDYVTRNVLEPLGMSSSGWTPAAGMAVGYYRKQGVLVPEPHPDDGVFAPAGGVYSSLRDLSRYIGFQLAAYGPPEATEVAPLRRSSVREMHRGQAWMRWGHDVPVASYDADKGLKLMASSYGFGWVNNTTCDYEGLVQHGGYEPGYYSYVRLMPRDALGLVTLSTTAAIGDYDTFRAALGLLEAQGLIDAGPRPTPALHQARLAVNRLLAHWDDALARATIDPVSLRYAFFATVGDDLRRLARDHGACEPDGDLAASSATQASWRMRCQRGAIDFSVWLSPASQPRVQHLTWREHPEEAAPPDAPIRMPPPRANAPCQAP